MTADLVAGGIGRRAFLTGAGALVVGFSLAGRGALAAGTEAAGAYGPAPDQVDAWLAIEADGSVTLQTGVCELGTGNLTALAQIMAEELDVGLAKVKIVGPDTDRTPDQFVSSGSRSISLHGVPIRLAAAEARQMLLERAAETLAVATDALETENGMVIVRGRPERTVSYGDLIGGRRFERKVTGKVKPKAPSAYRIVGKPVPRLDIPDKVNGRFTYVQDVKVPGMLHGRVVRPPAHGASVVSIDESSVAHLPGVVKVVRQGDLVGVVCQREEQAINAAQALKVTWSDWVGLPAMAELPATVRSLPVFSQGIPAKFPGGVLGKQGDVDAAHAAAPTRCSATYETPFHHHGSIGPSCAVADVRADGATIWSGTQTPFGLRDAAAQFLGLPGNTVRLIYVEASGCYGQNGADDVVIDALVLSRAAGKPVRVQWSRADENGWEALKAARVSEIRGAVDATGRIAAWDSNTWSLSGYSRPEYHEPRHGGEPGNLITAQLAGWSKPGLEEGFGGAAGGFDPPYTLDAKRVVFTYLGPASHRQGPLRIRVGSMRGVGAPDNLFVNESFMDELAAAAQADPIEFRLKHLPNQRAVTVLKAAAERAGWQHRPSPAPQTASGDISTGRGVALVASDNDTCVAAIFEVAVDRKAGDIQVTRVVVAHDCGLVVNPDGVRNQIEGGIIQGISRALGEEATFDRRRITSLDWQAYDILRFTDLPNSIDIVLVDRPDLPAMSVGEATTETVWAGVANAVFDAIGVRLRQLPLKPERVLAGLTARA